MLATNGSNLGGIVAAQVFDRDEDPAVIASHVNQMPVAFVVPLGEQPDNVTFSQFSSDWRHVFNIKIVGYWRFSADNTNPYSDINTARQYTFGLLEMFRYGTPPLPFYQNPGLGAVAAKGGSVDLGYYSHEDYMIYRGEAIVKCEAYEV
jgi:hypothetical protein